MIALKCTMITVTVALSLTFGAPASAHDCPKTGNQHKKEAGSMMMKGDGQMDRMQMHAQMKNCMMAKMDQDSESDPAKLREKMMAHMDSCMMSMMKPGNAPATEGPHKQQGSKQKSHDHNH